MASHDESPRVSGDLSFDCTKSNFARLLEVERRFNDGLHDLRECRRTLQNYTTPQEAPKLSQEQVLRLEYQSGVFKATCIALKKLLSNFDGEVLQAEIAKARSGELRPPPEAKRLHVDPPSASSSASSAPEAKRLHVGPVEMDASSQYPENPENRARCGDESDLMHLLLLDNAEGAEDTQNA